MIDVPVVIGIVIFMVGIVVSRRMTEKAYRQLSDQDRLRLIDAFASLRMWNMAPLLVVIAAVFLLRDLFVVYLRTASLVFAGALLVYLVFLHFLNKRILGRLNLPAEYLKAYQRARLVGYGALIALWAAVLLPQI